MNKEEILELRRKENRDERDEAIRDKSNKWVFVVMIIIAAIFAIVRVMKGETMLDLTVTVCSAMAVSNWYQYKYTMKRDNLISAIIISVVAVVCLIVYCMEM